MEGKSEQVFLTAVVSRFYADKPELQIISASGDIDQAERSINAIEQIFKPLERTLYGDRAIILLDKPGKQATLDNFIEHHKALQKNGQLFVLHTNSLEEYYPAREDWRRTPEHVADMDGGQKSRLAKRVGTGITQEEFEKGMVVMFDALNACWKFAY